MAETLMEFHESGDVSSVELTEIPFSLDTAVAWWSADSLMTSAYRNGDKVSSISDRMNISGPLIQESVQRQPIYVNSAVNGYPAIRFSSSTAQVLSNSTAFSTPCTVVCLSRYFGNIKSRVVAGSFNSWSLGHESGKTLVFNLGGYVINSGTSDTNWALYTAVIPGGINNSSVYKDGQLVASNNLGTSAPNGISVGGVASSPAPTHSDCEFAELIIFNSVLSEEELYNVHAYFFDKYLYQKPPRIDTTNFVSSYLSEIGPAISLLGYYRFEDDANDYSGYTKQGTWVGTAEYSTGIIGKSARCSPAKYIRVDNSSSIYNNNEFTVSLWLKLSSVYAGMYNYLCGTKNSSGGWSIYINPSTKTLMFSIGDSLYSSSYIVQENTWLNIIIVKQSNNSINFYINGAKVQEVGSTGTIESGGNLYIGRGGETVLDSYMNGYVDEVRYYDVVFTDVEAELLYDFGNKTRLINLNTNNGIYILDEFSEI